MPSNRFFTPEPLQEAALLTLSGPEAQHLRKSLRAKVGDRTEIVNGQGELAVAEIVEIGKRDLLLEIDQVTRTKKEPASLILLQGLPQLNRLDTIVEKATELGVDEIQIFPAERSEKSTLTPTQKERLKNISIAALKQSGRLFLPVIRYVEPITKWQKLSLKTLWGDPGSKKEISEEKSFPIQVVIGPESGLAPLEEKKLEALGAIGVTLHRHVLRTDTAAIVSLALLQKTTPL